MLFNTLIPCFRQGIRVFRMEPARRGFLRGRLPVPGGVVLRPPGALEESAFQKACTRCRGCLDACPTRIVRGGGGGYPEVDFTQGECTFCGACIAACTPRALVGTGGPPEVSAVRALWSMRAQLDEGCLARHGVECRVCGEVCPERAIVFRPRLGGVALPALDVAQCTGCGACVAPCPARAISMERQQ